jgi:hypothetical protein
MRHLALALALAAAAVSSAAESTALDSKAIDAATGLTGAMNQDEGVYKVTAPRTDIAVTIDGVALPPFMGLTSWAAFMPDPAGGAMVMGDLVLFEDEIEPVMSAALDHGLAVTALHNHFIDESPRVFFMHIGGQGPADKLAAGVRAALDEVKRVRGAAPQPQPAFKRPALPEKSAITADELQPILGAKPAAKDGMAKFTIGRSVAMPCGCSVGKEMGVATWAAFMGSDASALVDGDFVVAAGELQPVLRALRGGGIAVVAIHSHMEGETPELLFLHYWGAGPARGLASTIKSALDAQAAAKH